MTRPSIQKLSSFGACKSVCPWKQLFVEFVDGHSPTMGKGPLRREGLKCAWEKKFQKPYTDA